MQWLKWIYFVSILATFCKISEWLPITFSGATDIKNLVFSFFFDIDFAGFPVVGGSIWYMPIYFVVIVGNTIVMMMLQKSSNSDTLKRYYTFLLAATFIWVCFDKYLLGLDAKYYLFYSFFWMLGQNKMGKANSRSQLATFILLTLIGIVVSSYVFDIRLIDIQTAKFPPHIKYAFVSMVAIFIATYFEGTVRNRFLVHIGKNAIFYYFGQGVGSSLLYFFVDYYKTDLWFLKWCIALIINVFITMIIAELLAKSFIAFTKIMINIKRITTPQDTI